jgi:hypothetical protein
MGAALIIVTGYQVLLLVTAITITLAAIYLLTRPEQRQGARRRTIIGMTATSVSPAGKRTDSAPALTGDGRTAGPLDSPSAPREKARGALD